MKRILINFVHRGKDYVIKQSKQGVFYVYDENGNLIYYSVSIFMTELSKILYDTGVKKQNAGKENQICR